MLKIEKIKETAAGIKTEKPKILLFEAQKPKNRPNKRPNRKIENPPCSFGPLVSRLQNKSKNTIANTRNLTFPNSPRCLVSACIISLVSVSIAS